MSTEGQDMEEHLVQKYGPSARAMLLDPNSRLRQMGNAVGIQFNNRRRVVNTIPAHALMHYIQDKYNHDTANALMEELYERYFVQAVDISQTAVLMQAAQDVVTAANHQQPLDAEDVRKAMTEIIESKMIQNKDDEAKRGMGVTGVPFFILQNNNNEPPITFSGAYPIDAISALLQQQQQQQQVSTSSAAVHE